MASLLRTDKEITEIYHRQVDTVYRICYSFMKNKPEAEDMVQETFLRLIASGKTFENPRHEKAWLVVTASNLCKDQLKHIVKNGGTNAAELIEESQLWMAEQTAFLAKKLNAEIWLVGYSELKPKGIFTKYRDELKKWADWEKLFVFQHFSMNRFSIDLKEFMEKHKYFSLEESLFQLGTLHKNEIFG